MPEDTNHSVSNPVVCGLLACLLSLYPAVVSWGMKGVSAVFPSFAADAFYYLTVAKHTTWSPLFSFDGDHPTNGFHPVYQTFLKIFFQLPALANDQIHQLLFVYWVSAFFVAVAAGILAHRLVLMGYPSFFVLPAIVPGFFYLAVA